MKICHESLGKGSPIIVKLPKGDGFPTLSLENNPELHTGC